MLTSIRHTSNATYLTALRKRSYQSVANTQSVAFFPPICFILGSQVKTCKFAHATLFTYLLCIFARPGLANASPCASPRLLAMEPHSGCPATAHRCGTPSAALARPTEAFAAISARLRLAGGHAPFKRAPLPLPWSFAEGPWRRRLFASLRLLSRVGIAVQSLELSGGTLCALWLFSCLELLDALTGIVELSSLN